MDKYIIDYLDFIKYERKISENTFKSYRDNLKLFNEYFKGNIINLKKEDIEKYLKSIKKSAKTKSHSN